MNRSAGLKRFLAAACAGLLLVAATAPAQAGLVGTDTVLETARADSERARVIAALDREGVAAELESLGLDSAQAKARVARMTDAEVARLQDRIDEAAAGSGALEVALVVFIVFVVTDVIGATDVFPFIHPVK